MKIPTAIKARRLTLRRYLPQDLSAGIRFLHDEASIRYLKITPDDQRIECIQEKFALVQHGYDNEQTQIELAIADSETDAAIGMVRLVKNPTDGVFELEYYIERLYWGQGYATEAGAAMIGFALVNLGISRVRASMHRENLAAQRVAGKLGMKQVLSPTANEMASAALSYELGANNLIDSGRSTRDAAPLLKGQAVA